MQKRTCNRWTADEVAYLRKAIAVDVRYTTEITIAGRSVHGIRHKAVSLGLLGSGVSRRCWPIEHKLKLIRLRKKGFFARELAAILPYNVNAIQQQIKRMKLAS